jgi:hypothetical protein
MAPLVDILAKRFAWQLIKKLPVGPSCIASLNLTIQRFKDDLGRPIPIGVLEHQGHPEWISGSFLIPEKDNDIEWIWDFAALNKAIKRKGLSFPQNSRLVGSSGLIRFLL